MKRKYLTNKEKEIVGTKCANCESTIDLQYHHIIPKTLGGSDLLTNFVCLCGNCHSLIHYGRKRNANMSQLIKNGQNKAILNGKRLGKRKLSVQKFDESLIADIIRYDKKISKIKVPIIAKKHNISRNKVYKYIHLLNNIPYGELRKPLKYDTLIQPQDYNELKNGTLIDIMQIGLEWNEDKDVWINCVKRDDRIYTLDNAQYYNINEINESGYEFIIKYGKSNLL